ncbi:MAG: hypothetical protein JWN08_1246 [Frankiales bacterium]|nr:hypothetical protein [Frankiales bacterium]
MSLVCAVSFSRHGRLHYLDPGPFTVAVGDRVLVPTDAGTEVAECVWAAEWVGEADGLPVVAGLAGPADLARDEANRRRKAEVRVAAKRLVREHGLAMKVVAVDVLDREGKAVVYFTADGRIDFRELVRDLARTLDVRVELRSISARDDAKVQGGIGPCGRDTCCSSFLKDFEPVSLRMAKDQDLPLDPLRISGACGKLLCCLKYEHPLYAEFLARAPALGEAVAGGTVVGHDVPRDEVVVRGPSGTRTPCSLASVCGPRRAHDEVR